MKKGLPNPAKRVMFRASLLLVSGIALEATSAVAGSSTNLTPPQQNVTTVTYLNTGTYTETLSIPAGVCAITVQCYGAGGGGGGVNATGAGGGGGGGGFSQSIVYVTPGTNYTFTLSVGAVGTEGKNGTNGGSGGETSFNANVIIAHGGSGGSGASSGGSGAGGVGATAGIGTTTYSGGNGASGDYASYSGAGGGAAGTNGNGFAASGKTPGDGNGDYAGDGAPGLTTTRSGGAGSAYSGGGAGGFSSLGNAAAGTGAHGLVVISYGTPLTEETPLVNADVSCFGGINGSATAEASGGTSPYTYSWATSPMQVSATATALSAGSYTVTVTDTYGCTASASVSITQPTLLTVSASETGPDTCLLCANGSASASASGGTLSYSYSWNDANSTLGSNLTAVSQGAYTVTVTDANGCTATSSVTILWLLHSAVYHNDKNINLTGNTPASDVQNSSLSISSEPVLYQNIPNPFSSGAKINYYLPEGEGEAYLVFYDMYGNKVLSVELYQTGNGVLNISSDNLSPGIYSYSLIVNDRVIDTKRMILQK